MSSASESSPSESEEDLAEPRFFEPLLGNLRTVKPDASMRCSMPEASNAAVLFFALSAANAFAWPKECFSATHISVAQRSTTPKMSSSAFANTGSASAGDLVRVVISVVLQSVEMPRRRPNSRMRCCLCLQSVAKPAAVVAAAVWTFCASRLSCICERKSCCWRPALDGAAAAAAPPLARSTTSVGDGAVGTVGDAVLLRKACRSKACPGGDGALGVASTESAPGVGCGGGLAMLSVRGAGRCGTCCSCACCAGGSVALGCKACAASSSAIFLCAAASSACAAAARVAAPPGGSVARSARLALARETLNLSWALRSATWEPAPDVGGVMWKTSTSRERRAGFNRPSIASSVRRARSASLGSAAMVLKRLRQAQSSSLW